MSTVSSTGIVTGYSIDFWTNYVAPDLGVTDVRTTMLTDNNEIMGPNGLESYMCTYDSSVLCVGAAAISITELREAAFDFTASYYTNNVRILTTITPDPVDVLYTIIQAVWQLVVGIIIFSWFFNLCMAPLVWGIEMLTVPANRLPIFMPSDKDIDKFGGKTMWLRTQYIVTKSFKSAVLWTVYTFLGTHLARPQASMGRFVLLPLTRISSSIISIIATGACAAIFTIDASQAASISGVTDLGPSHDICYNTASSFNTRLVSSQSQVHGFRMRGYDGLASTLDAYYDKLCDAVIYDDVILQGDLIARRTAVLEGDRTYHRVQKSGVIGDSLAWDPYGFLLPSNNPHYEDINRAVIRWATDATAREALTEAYLRLADNTKTGIDLSTFGSEWVWMPSAVAAGLIFAALIGVYINVMCKSSVGGTIRNSNRASLGHQKDVRNAMRVAKADRGMADIAMEPASDLIHEMAFEIQDLQVTVHGALETILQAMDQSVPPHPRQGSTGATPVAVPVAQQIV